MSPRTLAAAEPMRYLVEAAEIIGDRLQLNAIRLDSLGAMSLKEISEITDVYLDESLHPDLGIAVVALVFGTASTIDAAVNDALLTAGLRPGVDEFKARAPFATDEKLRAGRDQLLSFANVGTALGLGVVPIEARSLLGNHALAALARIARVNGIAIENVRVHLDGGLFPKAEAARETCEQLHMNPRVLHPASDSVATRGLQVADIAANSFARIIRETVTGQSKLVADEEGGGEDMPIGWYLKMWIRWALLSGPHEIPGVAKGEPIVSVFPYAVYVDGLSDEMNQAVHRAFATAWLGCLS